MCQHDARYVSFDEHAANHAHAPRQRHSATFLLLIVLFGLGAHASTHALPVAAPLLEKLGLTPISYAAIALAPSVGQALTPALWGCAYSKSPRVTTIAAPFTLFTALALLAASLGFKKLYGSSPTERALLLTGLAVFSASRAGIGVVQHSALARGLRRSLTNGLILLVGTTHIIGAVISYVTPRIINKCGLFGMQLCLMGLGVIGVASAVALSSRLRASSSRVSHASPAKRRPSLFTVACKLCHKDLPSDKPYALICDQCERERVEQWRVRRILFLLGLWRACMVGALHAFNGVLNDLLVEHAFTIKGAGSFLAVINTISLVALPILALASSAAGVRPLLLVASALALCGACALLFSQHYGGEGVTWQGSDDDVLWWTPRVATLALGIAGVMAPVLPLALVPANSPSVGVAYGILDTMFYVGQFGSTLGTGAARQWGGFELALKLLALELLMSVVLAVVLLILAREEAPADTETDLPGDLAGDLAGGFPGTNGSCRTPERARWGASSEGHYVSFGGPVPTPERTPVVRLSG
mmetsp:Transcript_20609/g.44790  ORF Transcript_20609/g.44790 Transcript_20609/m.44790 type:complete len:531 (+) Transcript_20609:114-1706(+)